MTERVKITWDLQYYYVSPYRGEEGEWRTVEDFPLWNITEEEAKRQARVYEAVYKKVRLHKQTLVRSYTVEEVDFSE